MSNVFQTITAVKRDLGAVGKGNKMEAGPAKYKYRSIDDVLNALHGGLVEHGLVFAPQVESITQTSAGQTRSGTEQTRTVLEVAYLIAGPEGDTFTARTVGEAIDNGDKGTNKAATSALKVLLTQLLAIPFETDDPDDTFTEATAVSGKASTASPQPDKSSSTPAKAVAGNADGGEKTPSATPATSPAAGGRTCPTCTFAIGVKDTVKKGPDRKFHHTQCLNGETPAPTAPSADDISSIIGD